ncbi:MAG: FecR family protein [Methylococcales bacterium]
MSKLLPLPPSTQADAINQQAIEWFAKLRTDTLTTEERMHFSVWLETSVMHQQAFDEINAFWEDADFTELLQETPLSNDALNAVKALTSPSKPATRLTYPKYALALAACLAMVMIVYRPSISCLQADYCTAVGEIRSITLADGSQITLNSNTALTVAFNNQQRTVNLRQGEALFAVQRNPQLPFVVAGHFSNTRVLGTRFVIREDLDKDTVSVVSGLVEVSTSSQQKPALLKANDQIVVGQEQLGAIQQLANEDTAPWVKGRLLFDNASLNTVITELNRYRRGKVIIQNAALKALKVSGRFDISNTDNALESLQQTLPIHIYRITPWFIVIA